MINKRSERKGHPRSAKSDSGFAIAMVSLLLIPLLGFMALAIDVGAWYTQATRVQRAVDAAALSSVVWMPTVDKAEIVAIETMNKHGIDFTETYEDPTNGTLPRWDLTVESVAGNQFQVRVELTDNNAPVYFGGLFVENVTITRQAIAEFVKPVPLGSPGNSLAITCSNDSPAVCDDTVAPGYWLRMVGLRRPHQHGDYRAPGCLTHDPTCDPFDLTDPGRNPGYDERGYVFAIDVETPGTWVTVDLFDPAYSSGDPARPGPWDQDGGTNSLPTKFTLFEADGSNLTTPLLDEVGGGCTRVYNTNEFSGAWTGTTCHFYAEHADIYPLRIQTTGFPGANVNSNDANTFSLRSYTGTIAPAPGVTAGHPRVYAMEMMSIASRSNTTVFDLARIDAVHAGKTLSIKMYDPGDGSGQLIARFLGPYGPTEAGVGLRPQDCRFRSWDPESAPPDAWTDVAGNCDIETRPATGSSAYNDKWVEVQFDLPNNYACTGDNCYWKVDYLALATFGEGTTWSVAVIGDPVRLVG